LLRFRAYRSLDNGLCIESIVRSCIKGLHACRGRIWKQTRRRAHSIPLSLVLLIATNFAGLSAVGELRAHIFSEEIATCNKKGKRKRDSAVEARMS
jgi:hypothetical protein